MQLGSTIENEIVDEVLLLHPFLKALGKVRSARVRMCAAGTSTLRFPVKGNKNRLLFESVYLSLLSGVCSTESLQSEFLERGNSVIFKT